MRLTDLGVAFADGVGQVFVSNSIRERCATVSAGIRSKKSAPERFDFSGIARNNSELLGLGRAARELPSGKSE